MKNFSTSLRMFLWLTALTGLIYPLFITLIAHLTMRSKAKGSLIYAQEKVIGSRLIGQKFTSDQYFWSRPSAVDYNPLPSGGSNLSPISPVLKNKIEQRFHRISISHPHLELSDIPAELLFASASGLDPHISPKTAYFQIDRIIQARNLNFLDDRKKIQELVQSLTQNRYFGFLGAPCVNVLELNRALDELHFTPKSP